MNPKLYNHPCFNDATRHLYGRVHLPVAPRCNVQCNFCDRKFDCVNESRPGVSSSLLEPRQALVYLERLLEMKNNIAVVGIAGPGDPFANPEETMATLELVRERHPELLLCLATNGLNLNPYLDRIKEFNVSHVTVTVNALDPMISARIYSWVRFGKRVYQGEEGAFILMDNQLRAIEEMKRLGIVVKVNSIIIPGINDTHIPEIARRMGNMHVDIFNAIPLYHNRDCIFSNIDPPSPQMIHTVREAAAAHIPQMHHCTRCRADAAGLLGENNGREIISLLEECSTLKIPRTGPVKGRVAVASMEGILINRHLGEARELLIYEMGQDSPVLVDLRPAPEPGGGLNRWEALAALLGDCSALLVSGAGENPQRVLEASGISVYVLEGIIDEALEGLFSGKTVDHLKKRAKTVCGAECSGQAMGCM